MFFQNLRYLYLVSIVLLAFLSIFLIYLATQYNASFNNESETIIVGFSIYPLYSLGKEIIGDKLKTILLVPPGYEPHNYELSIQDISNIQKAKIIFYSGTAIDHWIENIKKIPSNNSVNFIPLNTQLTFVIKDDPHYWLSLTNAEAILKNIYINVVNIDKNNQDYYTANLNKALQKIAEIKKIADDKLKNIKQRKIITEHQSFRYFAKDLNLEIVATFQEENKESTLANIQNLINAIHKFKIKVIFKDYGSINNDILSFANNFNLKVYELDPLEGFRQVDYFDAYLYNINILKQALE
ncbi:MAG: metal ABC transporter substrate-binding lipoprotein [Candidatus Parcubacteria bacterium]|nr:MAG: metal ABC transporter substrate-binding lipoprotein [Candidatus Parcubacteria bacterium]